MRTLVLFTNFCLFVLTVDLDTMSSVPARVHVKGVFLGYRR